MEGRQEGLANGSGGRDTKNKVSATSIRIQCSSTRLRKEAQNGEIPLNLEEKEQVPVRKLSGKVSVVSIEGGVDKPAVVRDHTPHINNNNVEEEKERHSEVVADG